MINGTACKLSSYTGIVTVANNTELVPAATTSSSPVYPGNMIHRVMSMELFTGAGGLSTFQFKSATGGTAKYNGELPASSQHILPFSLGGYWETTAGQGIFVDVGTTAMYINFQYITYRIP